LNIIEKTLGLKHVKLVHLNDSKDPLGSRIDRHEHIGLGQIGDEGFRRILKSNLKKIPMVMETPIDEHLTDVDNMKKVKSLLNQTDKS
jgi:deoxyribonuclease-4